MTDFQLVLGILMLGVVAVIGVLLYNRLQERAVARNAQRAFGSTHADALMAEGGGDGRLEPTLQAAARRQHDVLPADSVLPDAAIDYLVELAPPRPLAAALAAEHWRAVEHRFGGRALLAGFDGAHWRRVTATDAGAMQALRAGLQLASRAGAVGEAELIEFRSEIETLAARLGAAAAAGEMRGAVETAQELDRFCIDADILVALHVVAPAGSILAADRVPEAMAAAMQEDAQGRPLFAVHATSERALTLTLDVPRAQDPARAYEAMVRAAHHLGAELGGELRDDNGNALDDRALTAIGTQVEAVRKALHARGLEPGGPLALRLFS